MADYPEQRSRITVIKRDTGEVELIEREGFVPATEGS